MLVLVGRRIVARLATVGGRRFVSTELHDGVGAISEGLGLGLAATAQTVRDITLDEPLILPVQRLAVFAHDLGLADQEEVPRTRYVNPGLTVMF